MTENWYRCCEVYKTMFKRNSAKVAESEFWVQIDPETGKPIGEPKEVDVVLKRADRNNFMITYLATI